MVRKEPTSQPGCVRVTFEIPASLWANHVYLVGDFNNWDRRATPFKCMPDGVWRVILDLPARQRYEFRYLIDDHWCTDYHADGCVERRGQRLNSFVDTTLPLESLASCTGYSMVHEAAFDKGMNFTAKRHS
jgi:hypothetical protein